MISTLCRYIAAFLVSIFMGFYPLLVEANQPPTASSPVNPTSTREDTDKSITLKGTDPERKRLTYHIVSQPSHGEVVVKNSRVGKAIYTPAENYFSPAGMPDSFTFKVNDGELDSAPATVQINVTTVNDSPVAHGSNVSAIKNNPQDISLSGSDVEGDPLTYILIKKSKKGGSVVLKSGNLVTYTPKLGYVGIDSFTFKVRDSHQALSKAATVEITVSEGNAAPTANAGADRQAVEGALVALSGRGTDPNHDTLAYTWVQTDSTGVEAALTDPDTATPSFIAPDVVTDTQLVFTLTVNDGHGGVDTDSVNVLVRNTPVVQEGNLNDTGITTCGDYAYDNSGHSNDDVDCSRSADAEGDPVPLGQDGVSGRDVTHNVNSDGDVGFSFTKISAEGQELPAAATEWRCVRDNNTGLLWEVKTDDGGLHDQDWTYTWYEPDNAQNGGAAGTANGGDCWGSQCDTSSYVQAVNAGGWCGVTAWRMPTVNELQSIAHLGRSKPAIDVTYFQDTEALWYFWSGEPYANDPTYAWNVYFGDGVDGRESRNTDYHVRLVR